LKLFGRVSVISRLVPFHGEWTLDTNCSLMDTVEFQCDGCACLDRHSAQLPFQRAKFTSALGFGGMHRCVLGNVSKTPKVFPTCTGTRFLSPAKRILVEDSFLIFLNPYSVEISINYSFSSVLNDWCDVKMTVSSKWSRDHFRSSGTDRKYFLNIVPSPLMSSFIWPLTQLSSRSSYSIMRKAWRVSKNSDGLHTPDCFPRSSTPTWMVQFSLAHWKRLRSSPEQANLNHLFLRRLSNKPKSEVWQDLAYNFLCENGGL
jgi:hypothetical protein